MFHLGEVKVRTGPPPDKLAGVVEEVEGEIKDGTGNGGVVDGHPGLVEMPSSRTVNACLSILSVLVWRNRNIPNYQDSRLFGESVLLDTSLEVDLATNGIIQVSLASNQVGESGRGSV